MLSNIQKSKHASLNITHTIEHNTEISQAQSCSFVSAENSSNDQLKQASGSSHLPDPSLHLITYAHNNTLSLPSFLSVFPPLQFSLNDGCSLSHTVGTGREELNNLSHLPRLL